MHQLRSLFIRLFALLRPGTAESDFRAELESHIAMHTADGVRAGLSEEEARRQALIRLGGAEQTAQTHREGRILPLIESIIQDVRFGVRQLRKAPGFGITAIATLALGIGANAVIYTILDDILLRPLPYPAQDCLMRITGTTMPLAPKGWIRALGENSKSFSSISGYGADAEYNYSDNGSPDRVFGSAVTVNMFSTLGIQPSIGEFFVPDDAIAGQDNKVVLSYGYWQQRYGGAASVIGQQVKIDGRPRRIIGVMPSGIYFPYVDTQFVFPVSFNHNRLLDPWSDFDLHLLGRLADGVTPQESQSELRHLHDLLLPKFPFRMPDIWASDMTVTSLLEEQTGSLRPRLLLMFGAAGLVLLIACANVANLMLVRSVSRESEMAIRGALGASNRRLFRQLLSESVVVGLISGIVAMVAAAVSVRLLLGMLPTETPRIHDIAFQAREVLFTFGASLLAGILFGILPAISISASNVHSSLRASGRGLTGKRTGGRTSSLLAVAQIGFAVMVVIVAGLMLRSLYKIGQVDPGLRTDHVVTAEIALDNAACKEKGRCNAFFRTLVTRAQSISGVQAVALSDSLPFSNRDGNFVYDAEDHPRQSRQGALVATGRIVSPDFFKVLGLHLVNGRLLTEEDSSGTTHAVLINEHMAQKLWPGQNPIGKHLIDVDDEPSPAVWAADKAAVVVGVLRNAHERRLDSGYTDEVFLPMSPTLERPVVYLLVLTHVTQAEAAEGVRRAVAALDAAATVTHVRSLHDIAATSISAPRSLAALLVAFGGLAVLIGTIGIYSLIAYIVSMRTGEIGLRLALGAQRQQVELLFLKRGVSLAAVGCLVGMSGALALGRLTRQFLFEVSPLDPMTFVLVAACVLLITLVAAWIPARRAAAVDPMVAVRQ